MPQDLALNPRYYCHHYYYYYFYDYDYDYDHYYYYYYCYYYFFQTLRECLESRLAAMWIGEGSPSVLCTIILR